LEDVFIDHGQILFGREHIVDVFVVIPAIISAVAALSTAGRSAVIGLLVLFAFISVLTLPFVLASSLSVVVFITVITVLIVALLIIGSIVLIIVAVVSEIAAIIAASEVPAVAKIAEIVTHPIDAVVRHAQAPLGIEMNPQCKTEAA